MLGKIALCIYFFSKFCVKLVHPNDYKDGQASHGISSIQRQTRLSRMPGMITSCLVHPNWSLNGRAIWTSLGVGAFFVTPSSTITHISHGFKNRTGHQTIFKKISGSTLVFARFFTGFSIFDRLLTSFRGFNRTELTLGSRSNRSIRYGF